MAFFNSQKGKKRKKKKEKEIINVTMLLYAIMQREEEKKTEDSHRNFSLLLHLYFCTRHCLRIGLRINYHAFELD